jgi:trans-aconitate methyltransferase
MAEIREAQTWSAQGYAQNAAFVPAYGSAVLDLLAPRPDERILDLGCGDGVLTGEIAARGAAVVGVDSSAELLAQANARGLETRRLDGQALTFRAEFDAVFTNAALHWMRDHDAVIQGVRRALKPGGRFVGEFGGHGNVAAIVTALLAALEKQGIEGASRIPWVFPTPEEWRERLERHGFRVDVSVLLPRPTPLPTGMAGWLATFANPFVADLSPSDQEMVLANAVRLLAPALRARDGAWTADYVRLRFAATLP